MARKRVTAQAVIHRAPRGVDADGYPLSDRPWDEWETVTWPVWSIGPRWVEEEFHTGRRTVATGIRVSAPIDGPLPDADDLVSLPGFEAAGPWQVNGEVQLWDNNPITPFTRFRGAVVNLERSRR